MNMKNFKVTAKEDGKEYWISRAHAVVGIVYSVEPGTGLIHYLISKRGPGCPNYVGSWGFTCGYLDWGETRKEAVKRELWEELGLKVNLQQITRFCEIDDPGRDERENIVTRYLIEVDFEDLVDQLYNDTINGNTESRGGEAGEVSDIKLVTKDSITKYPWAFNHGNVMLEAEEFLKTGKKPSYGD